MDRFSRDPVGTPGPNNNGYNGVSRAAAGIQTFMAQVYGWMGAGLLVTAVVAYFTANSIPLLKMVYQYYWILFIAQLAFVWMLSGRIHTLSSQTATMLFLIYSTLSGLSLSGIFIVYTSSSIASVFAISAGMFGAMSIYGYTTKKDLSSWGSALFMLLIGLIIATLANIFLLQSTGLAMVLPYIGVLIFVGLTIYDTNMLRRMGEKLEGNEEAIRKYSVYGALSLYLDFINIFLYLLRIFGNRR